MPIVYNIAMVAVLEAAWDFAFNFSPSKTFMGDGGALFLGFMITNSIRL